MAPLQETLRSFQTNDPAEIRIRSRASSSTAVASSKTKVSFQQLVSVRTTLDIADMTRAEKTAMWYNQIEIREIRAGVRNDITALSTGRLTPNHCASELRGLESFLPEGLAIKKLRREIARNAVLDLQEHQWTTNSSDPELLADIYFERTRESVATAHVQGLADQEVVHQYLDSLSSDDPSSSMYISGKVMSRSGSIGSLLQRRQPLEFSCRAA